MPLLSPLWTWHYSVETCCHTESGDNTGISCVYDWSVKVEIINTPTEDDANKNYVNITLYTDVLITHLN